MRHQIWKRFTNHPLTPRGDRPRATAPSVRQAQVQHHDVRRLLADLFEALPAARLLLDVEAGAPQDGHDEFADVFRILHHEHRVLHPAVCVGRRARLLAHNL